MAAVGTRSNRTGRTIFKKKGMAFTATPLFLFPGISRKLVPRYFVWVPRDAFILILKKLGTKRS